MYNFNKKQIIQEEEYLIPYHYLDLTLDQYKYLWSLEYLNLIKCIKELIKPFTGQKILDVGCGDGRFCYEIQSENVDISGLDYSERALNFAKILCQNVLFHRQDITKINLDYKYDYIIAIEVFEHLSSEDLDSTISKLKDVLANNGKFILSVPTTNIFLEKKHFQHFNERKLTKILKKHFKFIKIIGFSKNDKFYYIFLVLRAVGYFIYPLRKKSFYIIKYFIFLDKFFNRYLLTGKPEKCRKIIAICENK